MAKIIGNCIDCGVQRLVSANGESADSYFSRAPRCRSCGVKNNPNTGQFTKGITPWNKGLNVNNSDILRAMGEKISRSNLGIRRSPNTEFRKGIEPWNKGKKHIRGDKHANWKGDNVGYSALHSWVKRRLGYRPKKCIYCKKENTKKGRTIICWANVSHEYKRDLSDWMPLCYSCHKIYDLCAT